MAKLDFGYRLCQPGRYPVLTRRKNAAMTDPRLNNPASAADTRLLTGETTPAAQRAACDRLGIRYHQRRIALPGGRRYRLVDECTIWVDHDVLARLTGDSSPTGV